MQFRGLFNKENDKFEKGYTVDYKSGLKNAVIKIKTSTPLKVFGVALFGAVLVVAASQVPSSAASQKSSAKVKDWGVTAGVASEIKRADGVLKLDLTELVAISNNNAIATAVAEIPQETEKSIKELLPDYSNLGVANVDNYLNIRDKASEEGSLCGKLPKNAGCEILEESDGGIR